MGSRRDLDGIPDVVDGEPRLRGGDLRDLGRERRAGDDHLAGRAVGDDLSGGEHDDAVRGLGDELDVVRGDDDAAPPLGEVAQAPPQGRLAGVVEPARGFVEQQARRTPGEQCGQGEPGPLAAREGAHRPRRRHRTETEPGRRLLGPTRRVPGVVEDGPVEQRGVLLGRARVVEAGVGSGALSLWLLRAVGPTGRLASFERRDEFADVARANVETFLGYTPDNWTVTVGDLVDELPGAVPAGEADRVVLDMLAPWECLDVAAEALTPGGVLPGDHVTAAGRASTRGRRPVVLEVQTPSGWATASTSRTTRRGQYAVTDSTARTGTFRVVLPHRP